MSSFTVSNSTDYLHRARQLAALPGVLVPQPTVTALSDNQLTAEAFVSRHSSSHSNAYSHGSIAYCCEI